MSYSFRPPEQIELLPHLGKWLFMAILIAILAGSASAVFLILLEHATQWRQTHRWIIWLLPLAGMGVGLVYHLIGQEVEAGNNLIIDQIHNPTKQLSWRMAPLVLGGTVIAHLFGASVGREGTAVQMSGSLADQLTPIFRLPHEDRRLVLMTGVSAGFAAVFGTPLAGAVFGLEMSAIGRMRYDALFPCLIAALLADQVCLAFGVQHTTYVITDIAPIQIWSMLAVALAGILFGLVGAVFARSAHKLGAYMKRYIAYPPLRPLVGGAVIALAVWMLDAYHYIGLGIPDIVRSFNEPMKPWDFLGKMGFTIASLGSGFKGGEVTPLFYIGATLGNTLAPLLQLPFSMLAGIGFVAVFAAAVNTPIATTLMAMELFGAEIGPFAAIGCVTAYLCSGHTGIYPAQRIGYGKSAKHRRTVPETLRLAELPSFLKQTDNLAKERLDTQDEAVKSSQQQKRP